MSCSELLGAARHEPFVLVIVLITPTAMWEGLKEGWSGTSLVFVLVVVVLGAYTV